MNAEQQQQRRRLVKRFMKWHYKRTGDPEQRISVNSIRRVMDAEKQQGMINQSFEIPHEPLMALILCALNFTIQQSRVAPRAPWFVTGLVQRVPAGIELSDDDDDDDDDGDDDDVLLQPEE